MALSAAMLVIYFGFILLGAYAKGFMGTEIAAGLSIGILFGALVIIAAFGLTGIYVRWANGHDKLMSVAAEANRGNASP